MHWCISFYCLRFSTFIFNLCFSLLHGQKWIIGKICSLAFAPVDVMSRPWFNQSTRSEWFRRILYFISLRFYKKWPCSKRNGPCFSCASIELWMHLGSLESTCEAREALGFASCHSNASLVLSQLPACICNSIDARQAWTISLIYPLYLGKQVLFLRQFFLLHDVVNRVLS